MKKQWTTSTTKTFGLRASTHLRAGFDFTDLDSFSKALIENIQIYDNQAIPADEVETCASDFLNAADCVDYLYSWWPDSVETAMNDTVEQCKQASRNWRECDSWGDSFGVPFGHG
jgi:hypothetical protein